MRTHPKYPARERDTGELLRPLFWAAIALGLILALTNCGTAPPRAIIPPPSVIAELDVSPVSDATTKTRTAVREIADAGRGSREATAKLASTSEQLRDAIDRAEALTESESALKTAFEEIQRFALRLSDDLGELQTALKFAEVKEKLALETIDGLVTEVSELEADAASQASEIRAAKANEQTLRTQVEALSTASDDLAIAKDKLAWWRWRFAPVTIGIVFIFLLASAGLVLVIIYKPSIPFLP